MYPLTDKLCRALLHPNPRMHLVPTDFSSTPASEAPDEPSAGRDIFDMSKQTPTPTKSQEPMYTDV